VALREALAPHADRIRAAFVYGSMAKGEETARSDIDLIVIGDDVTYSDFFDGFLKAEELLHRPVHAFFLSPNEWKGRLTEGSPFFTKINAQLKFLVMGSRDDLAACQFRNWRAGCAWGRSGQNPAPRANSMD